LAVALLDWEPKHSPRTALTTQTTSTTPKGNPWTGFRKSTVNTPYEAILDGSVETIDTSVTTLRASAFANMTNLTKLVLRNASSLLSTIQNALPTDLSQGAELNIYVPSSSLDDYAALYGSVYTVNDISLPMGDIGSRPRLPKPL
jgi:hypothetical protein